MNKNRHRIHLFFTLLILLTASQTYSQWQWTNPKPQGNDLWNVHFANTTTGWAVGGGGTILKSTDAGATWSWQESYVNDFLRGVCAPTADQAWVVGDNGLVFHTNDGGNSWQQQSIATTEGINDVHAVTT